MFYREFWITRLRQVWERVPIAWLAGVRRVGKTTLVRSLPEAECLYVNCDSPRTAQAVADPEFFFHQVRRPVVRGTRITVQSVLEFLSAGDSVEEVLEEYPDLTREDVLACLAFASGLMEHGYVVETVS